MKILIIDDEKMVAEHLKGVLSRKDDKVDYALSAEEALKALNDFIYDLVFVDYRLPGKSGLEIVDFIKKKFGQTKVAMLTGYPLMKETIAKFVGVDEYLEKPIDIGKIEEIVEKYRPQA